MGAGGDKDEACDAEKWNAAGGRESGDDSEVGNIR